MIEGILTFLGILVPCTLIVLATRRWLERVSWRLAALLFLIVMAFIARGVFTTEMPVPLDEVVRGYPYRGLFGEVRSKNFLANDITKQILPWMHVVREELAHGRAPLWNRYLFSGYPLLGNGQSAPFSPIFLATLFVPLPKQLVAMAGVKLFLALLFGFLLLKRERVSDAAALFGSGVFAFAIVNSCFLYYPLTSVSLMLPLVAYAALRTLEETRASYVVLTALGLFAILAGGHPESAAHILLGVAALVLIEWAAPASRRFALRDLGRLAAASICGVLLAAPAWVPVAEQAAHSLRVLLLAKSGPLPPMTATALWALANPEGFGNPAKGTWNWFLQYPQVASMYFGSIVMALIPGALVARGSSRRDRLLVIALVLLFVTAFGWTPLGWFFSHVRPLSLISHERLVFVCAFLAGIIAARATSRLRGQELAIAVAASAMAIGAGVYVLVKTFGRTTDAWSAAGVAALLLFWMGVLALRARPAGVAALACVLTLAELFLFTFPYNAMTDGRYYAPHLPILEALKARAPRAPFRILGFDWVFLPNAAAQYGVEDIRGTDPMEWDDYARYFATFEVKDASIDFKRVVDVDRPFVDFLNVRFLLTEPGQVPAGDKWERVYRGRDGDLYENRAAWGRFFAPDFVRRTGAKAPEGRTVTAAFDFANPGGVEVDGWLDRPTRYKIRVTSPRRAFVASSQPAMPGWRLRINGRPADVVTINGAFLGFFVGRGTSRVEWEYVPVSYYGSLAVAVGALAGLIFFAVRRGRNTSGGGGVIGGPYGSPGL